MLERCHRLARLGDPAQNLARVNKQSFAGFSKNHRARQSIEQLLVQFLFQLMDLLTERRLRDMLALRRVGEATLLRDRNKVPELMNFHRRSDTPLGPPVCLRLADRHFWIRLGSIRAWRVVLGALAEQLFLISDL